MKYGLHNALTAYYLKGWMKHFDWLVQPFSKCQYKSSLTKEGVVLVDLQVSLYKGKWYGSHGLVWYNAPLNDILQYMNGWCIKNSKTIYLRLGYDNHWFTKLEEIKFLDLVERIKDFYHNHITLYEWYIERTGFVYRTDFSKKVFERYWTLSWAKSQVKKHWWKFYLFLPIPWLWAKLYKKEWLEEFKNSGKEIFMTDFV